MRSPVVLFVLLLLVSSVSAQSSGGWLRDELTGCHVWNSNPEIGKTFNWSGNCSNNVAAGPGVMRWYVRGSPSGRYVGEYENGRMSGRGVFEYRNGDRYEGEFSDDRPNGYGTLTRANGTRYSGLFRDGHPVHDEATPGDSKAHEAEPRDPFANRGETTFADGSRYKGDFHDGKMSGWGVFTTKAGDRYEGEFADDRPNGFGTYKEADGSTYAGLWKNGCFRQSNRAAAVMATEKECSFGARGRPY
ncbi:MAG: hypothetical protein Q8K93_24255 [Reyranella sp.]|uniref:MORN repeat-containing protein n=1 Tax=Reyranella sp. TaxID=1929291 RepID=UPI002730AFB4|nr:hypothetical protein [Reyranella sp.]MDP1965309.1 hypothetical protein [Reyranella sp.]MDP2378007.1 hypothetical protein [Reyranella sp.]